MGFCASSRAGKRKCHNDETGYICQRDNPHIPGAHVVIYEAEKQGLDPDSGRYAVVCEAHGSVCNTTNLPDARLLMKSVEFCYGCMFSSSLVGRSEAISGDALTDLEQMRADFRAHMAM